MKKLFRPINFLVVFVLLVGLACGGGANTPEPTSADLWIAIGPNALHALGNGSDGGPLNKWADAKEIDLYVQVIDGFEANNLKDQTLTTQNGPDAFILDDGLYADGLKNSLSVAQSHTVLWIEDQAATSMGLPRGVNTISMDQYVQLLNSGQLSLTAGNGVTSTTSAAHFFGILAWCSQQNTANLTMEMVNSTSIQDCGKTVYDYIKTSSTTTDAINLVYSGIVNKQANAFNSVIAFDSSFLGENGLNQTMIKEAGTFMRAFYFVEATPVSVVTFGTKDLSQDHAKNELLKDLGNYLVGDEGQLAFNQAGLGNGASSSSFPDESAFNADWGVTMYPSQYANVINPPVTSVAFDAITIYAQYYKRAKVVYFLIDTSKSMETQDDGTDGLRLQLVDRAIVTVTDQSWLQGNSITLGKNDKINYRFFSDFTSVVVAESIGDDTKQAGDRINSLIGPAFGAYNFWETERNVQGVDNNYYYSGTAMFDAAETVRKEIEANYDPNTDYYIVILTDGQRYGGIDFNTFKSNWENAGHKNISLFGIQFGDGDGISQSDVRQEIVEQVNGKHYDGNNTDDLIQALKDIFNN